MGDFQNRRFHAERWSGAVIAGGIATRCPVPARPPHNGPTSRPDGRWRARAAVGLASPADMGPATDPTKGPPRPRRLHRPSAPAPHELSDSPASTAFRALIRFAGQRYLDHERLSSPSRGGLQLAVVAIRAEPHLRPRECLRHAPDDIALVTQIQPPIFTADEHIVTAELTARIRSGEPGPVPGLAPHRYYPNLRAVADKDFIVDFDSGSGECVHVRDRTGRSRPSTGTQLKAWWLVVCARVWTLPDGSGQ